MRYTTAMAGSALAKHPFSVGVLRRAARKGAPLALVAASAALYVVVLASSGHEDLDAYLAAGRTLLAGQPLYAVFLHHPFPDPTLRPAYIYPPVFAVLIAPLTWLPRMVAGWTWLLAMQAALGLSLMVAFRAWGPAWTARWVAAVLTFSFFPLHVDVTQGQTNLPVLALLVLGVVGILRGQHRAGVWLGVAAAIKISPLLLLGWLLFERRWRAAAFLGVGFAGATGLGALVRPGDTVTFFGQVLPALARGTAYYSNQSLAGVLGRLLTANPYTNPWLVVPWESVLALAAGLALLGWWAFTARQFDPSAAAFAFLPLLPLLSSVTWEHHLVVLLPVIWLSVVRLAGRGWPIPATALLAASVACLSVLPRWHPGPAFGSAAFRAAQTGDPLTVLTANALFGGTLILFLGSRWLLRSH
jgi:alpha-1,2-mannosyltransferase